MKDFKSNIPSFVGAEEESFIANISENSLTTIFPSDWVSLTLKLI